MGVGMEINFARSYKHVASIATNSSRLDECDFTLIYYCMCAISSLNARLSQLQTHKDAR